MNATKKAGVWMDYSEAHIMEFSENPIEIKVIKSNFKNKLRSNEKDKSEKHLHALEKQCKADYFKEIATSLLNYDKVLLFGPTNAKNELYNSLTKDTLFSKIKLYVKESGKLTFKQRSKFIYEHFASPVYR